jgi:hypothetical protein
MIITSSGVIKNENVARPGILSVHTLADFVYDEIDNGIDLTYEDFLSELESRGIEQDSKEWYKECDLYEPAYGNIVLFGDWVKNKNGQYEINFNGEHGYAAEYSSSTGNISVEYSKTTVRCHHTSPCYVMANGDGPCGDLNTPGDAVLAFTLPSEFFRSEF